MPDSNGWISAQIVGAALILGCFATISIADELGVKVPDGFEVVEFAGDELAHDIYSLTIDSRDAWLLPARDTSRS
jgi:hypothetical protein